MTRGRLSFFDSALARVSALRLAEWVSERPSPRMMVHFLASFFRRIGSISGLGISAGSSGSGAGSSSSQSGASAVRS
jgi:hypothetical protein